MVTLTGANLRVVFVLSMQDKTKAVIAAILSLC